MRTEGQAEVRTEERSDEIMRRQRRRVIPSPLPKKTGIAVNIVSVSNFLFLNFPYPTHNIG